MRRIGFSVYKIQLKDQYSDQWWDFGLNSSRDGYSALKGALDGCLNRLVRLGEPDPATAEYLDDRAVKLARLDGSEPHRRIKGILFQGEAGVVQDIYDFNNPHRDPTYTIRVNEGALLPLYFRLYLEDGQRHGIAILQTFGGKGLKGAIEDLFRKLLRQSDQPLTIKFTQLVDKHVLEQFARQGQMQDVILVNRGGSQSSRTAMQNNTVGNDALGDQGDKLELKLHKKGGWTSRTLKALARAAIRREDPRSLVHAPGVGPVDDLLVEIVLGQQRQRFSLLNPDDSPIRYDKTDQLIPESNGYPSYGAIDAAADEVWQDVQLLR
jgi:hypothetical protein